MKWEVFNMQDGKVLADFNNIESADKFIALFEDTDIGSQLQTRQNASASGSSPILRVVRGVPGSGKSTFAVKHFPGVFHVENDMFLMRGNDYHWTPQRVKSAIDWCSRMATEALASGLDVVVCNTFTKRRFIRYYKNIAEELGARFDVYRCTGSFKNVHGLDDSMVEKFKKAMEDWPGETFVSPSV